MTDDDASRTSEVERPTIPGDSREAEEIPELPNLPEEEDFVKTQEMDSMKRERASGSGPHDAPSLETTQRYDVPDDLLQMAMRSQEMSVMPPPEEDWREFVGVVDPRGRIVLPSRVQKDLQGRKLRVKYIVDD